MPTERGSFSPCLLPQTWAMQIKHPNFGLYSDFGSELASRHIGSLELADAKRRSTQPTHRELAPQHAAGKVPVPWGRECHWETKRPAPEACSEALCRAVWQGAGHLQKHSHAVSTRLGANERGSFSPCLLPQTWAMQIKHPNFGLYSNFGNELASSHIGSLEFADAKRRSRLQWRQGKHGHAANTQGARSPACCGESPRALGQRVSLGDQKASA